MPCNSRCPSSVLGNSRPSMNKAVPMPVPNVSMMAVPATPRPAPQRISAMPAASASFKTTAGRRRVRSASAAPSRPSQAWSIFAAVRTRPDFTTLGKARPTGPCAPGSRSARAATTCITPGGAAGWGVGAEISSPSRRPESTSTSPALTEEPPTSMPITVRVIDERSSNVGSRCELQVACPPPALKSHPHRGHGDSGADQQHHERRERIHVGTHTEAHLGEDHHRQGARARPGHELRDDQVVPGERERQQPPREQSRCDQRQGDAQEYLQRTRAEIHSRLFEGLIETSQPRLYHHRDISHRERDVSKRDRKHSPPPRPSDHLLERDE